MYGVIDIASKPKLFFKNQKFVNFKKLWYFHDSLKLHEKIDMEYLKDFERSNDISLWKLALNERYFYQHNRFYKFKKDEIISILYQEIKLFESILNEVKPDYLLTYEPVFHHQKLLVDLCRLKGIKIISIFYTGIQDIVFLSDDGSNLNLDKNSFEKNYHNYSMTNNNQSYDKVWSNYASTKNPKLTSKITALLTFLTQNYSESLQNNFMYFGRSKFSVLKDSIKIELKRLRNYDYIQQHFDSSPNIDIPFVYFPMNINEEMNLLHYAPFYTNQIDVIRNVSKSIPIDYLLLVKEHIGAGLRGWNDIQYYKEILEIPNVKLVHPNYDNNKLIEKSKLVITIRGSSGLTAVKYQKPSIIFGPQPFEFIPSVYRVKSFSELPNLIKKAISTDVDKTYYEKYHKFIETNGVRFNMFSYENIRDKSFFGGGILSNIPISNTDMQEFLSKNQLLFSDLVRKHIQIFNE